MSKIELDDGILDHPKFVRAVQLAGSCSWHLWCGLRAYCSQQLTDGFVPSHMLSEVRGPTSTRRRRVSFDALLTVGLLESCEGGVRLHDYLDWAASRAQVLAWRKANTDRKRKSREKSHRDIGETPEESHGDIGETEDPSRCDDACGHAVSHTGIPAPSPSPSRVKQKREKKTYAGTPDGEPADAAPKVRTDRQLLIDHYFAVFTASRGSKPPFAGREGKSVDALMALSGGDLARAMAILTNAYQDGFWAGKSTINTIAADAGRFVGQTTVKQTGGRRGPVQPNSDEPDGWKLKEF